MLTPFLGVGDIARCHPSPRPPLGASSFVYLFYFHVKRHPENMPKAGRVCKLARSSRSNWFGISSVQLSSLGTSFFLGSSFSSVRDTGAKCLRSFRSVQFIQLSSRTLPAPVHWQATPYSQGSFPGHLTTSISPRTTAPPPYILHPTALQWPG